MGWRRRKGKTETQSPASVSLWKRLWLLFWKADVFLNWNPLDRRYLRIKMSFKEL